MKASFTILLRKLKEQLGKSGEEAQTRIGQLMLGLSKKGLVIMMKAKPIDLYEYQRLLLMFIRNETTSK